MISEQALMVRNTFLCFAKNIYFQQQQYMMEVKSYKKFLRNTFASIIYDYSSKIL